VSACEFGSCPHMCDVSRRRECASIVADAIANDVAALARAWRAYQRTYSVPIAGQLDLFAQPRAET
jgi:hypothetical protein